MQAVENLKKAELQEQQAVAIVETIRDSQVEFATRDDLHAVRDDLRAELEKLGFVLRGEMRDEIGKLRTEMHDRFAGMQDQLATMYWRLLIGIGIIAGIFGTIVTLAGGK